VAVYGIQAIVVFKDDVVWPCTSNAIDFDDSAVANSQDWRVARGAKIKTKVQALT
jgi:hypothetical protein